ncbi:ATP-dependent nuclease [Ramlibacter sp. AN1133]|uniref:ATP-dependent nuclease n=1 Tax=Ramlibacter sp. AN1133 TaxID=3133429 RepID=UPI0030C1EDD8
MIEHAIQFALPAPWKGQTFSIRGFNDVNFLVGPNGTGKSVFARLLRDHLPNSRLLATDRLSGMESASYRHLYGDNWREGFQKNQFENLKGVGRQQGLGIDALILLEERLDLRVQVEATLSHLFNRKIRLEWNSGHLVPYATLGSAGTPYRLDREECHGIKELLVLLTHLYDEANPYLIVDEPELNLHPQYQSFLMQEVRRVAGNPKTQPGKKAVFLVTHSPFILDFRSIDDVKAIISFSQQLESPIALANLNEEQERRVAAIVPRLNAQHKQFFFSDNPIFVEGIIDAQLVETIQEARGVSVAGAGSCVIAAGGCEEVNQYLTLSLALKKNSHFLYDLDSLFFGSLKGCLKSDGTVQSFLARAGVGHDLARYAGQLEGRLTELVDRLLGAVAEEHALHALSASLSALGPRRDWNGKAHARARVALLVALNRERAAFLSFFGAADTADVEGRLKLICETLKSRSVLLLPGGTLEHYLPSFAGNPYDISDESKKSALASELEALSRPTTRDELRARYGQLFELIELLPGRQLVDAGPVLRDYLSDYIHDLQGAIQSNPDISVPELQAHMAQKQKAMTTVFHVTNYVRREGGSFCVTVTVEPLLGHSERRVDVTEHTNAGMRQFTLLDV